MLFVPLFLAFLCSSAFLFSTSLCFLWTHGSFQTKLDLHRPFRNWRLRHFCIIVAFVLLFFWCLTPQVKAQRGIITTVAGGAPFVFQDGPALQSPLGKITSVVVDAAGNVYAADISKRRVISIAPSGALVSVLNLPDPGYLGTDRLAMDGAGNLYVLETGTGNTPPRIIRRDPVGELTTIIEGGGLSNNPSDLATLAQHL